MLSPGRPLSPTPCLFRTTEQTPVEYRPLFNRDPCSIETAMPHLFDIARVCEGPRSAYCSPSPAGNERRFKDGRRG